RRDRTDALTERYAAPATLDNAAAVVGAGLVVVSVKPQDIEALLEELTGHLEATQTVLSVAAAIPTSAIELRLAGQIPVVRAMPNAPSTVHEGIAGICAGTYAGDENLQ